MMPSSKRFSALESLVERLPKCLYVMDLVTSPSLHTALRVLHMYVEVCTDLVVCAQRLDEFYKALSSVNICSQNWFLAEYFYLMGASLRRFGHNDMAEAPFALCEKIYKTRYRKHALYAKRVGLSETVDVK